LVKPFPGLRANESYIEGKLLIDQKEYLFTGENKLTIDNIDHVLGLAVASDGSQVFFDKEGAGVEIDELGYWEGLIFSDEVGLVEVGLNKDAVVRIDLSGKLEGNFKSKNKEISFEGQSDWRPFELAEIKTDQNVKLMLGSKTKLDVQVIGLAGRKLDDVQIVYESNNTNVVVDEYGYLEIGAEGNYREAVTVRVGDSEKKVSIQAVSGITRVDLSPSLLVIPFAGDIEVSFVPAEVVFGIDSSNFVSATFVRGTQLDVQCGGFRKLPGGQFFLTSCNFPSDEYAGVWNLELKLQEGTYAFPSVLTVLKQENAINVSLVANVSNDGGDSSGDNILSEEPPGDQFRNIEYMVLIDWPSVLFGDGGISGNVDMNVIVNFSSEGVDIAGQAGSCDSIVVPSGLNLNFSDEEVRPENAEFDLGTVRHDGGIIAGCDFVAKADVTFDITLPSGEPLNNAVKGAAEVRTGMAARKMVSLEGDVVVQEGDLQIRRLDEDQNLYLLVAGDTVNVSGRDQGNVEGYELGEASTYEILIGVLREKVDKLIIERGFRYNSEDESVLETFTEDDIAKNPEGRILYNSDLGIMELFDRSGSDTLRVCAPTTLVIKGRDVIIKDNIKMAPDNDTTCVERGNFGLIVFDGDIYIDGAVNSVEGFYFTTGTIHTGLSHEKFSLKGVAFAHDYVLQRF
ncbi:hypothetical protein KJ855_03895, partial [Patescibacteria group bacterium]|nr:hypothetical protein [Patescibacteria group bacterium]